MIITRRKRSEWEENGQEKAIGRKWNGGAIKR